jgi:hypothetical protein
MCTASRNDKGRFYQVAINNKISIFNFENEKELLEDIQNA